MSIEEIITIFVLLAVGFAVGYNIKQDEAQYQTNLAKFEVMYEKCMGHKKGTVSECQKLAEFKSKACVTGCE